MAGSDNAPSSPPLFPRWLLVLAGIGAVLGLFYLLQNVLTPIFVAALIAYMLDPLVDRLEARKIPRAAGIVVVLFVFLLLATAVALLVIPGVVREVVLFAKELPEKLERLWVQIEPWLKQNGINPPHSLKDAYAQLGIDSKQIAEKAAAPAGDVLGAVFSSAAGILGALANGLIIPVIAFYLLHDWDRMMAAIRDLIPHRVRGEVVEIAQEVDEVLGNFIRGQLLVMLLLAILYSVAYALLGVRLAIPIGIVAGLLSFIPYVGGAAALGLALLMCVLTGTSWTQVGGVVAAYAVIQLLEGFLITPRIMEDKIGLGAVWVILALMVFGELLGFTGVLIAVPAAAVTKIFLIRAVNYYRSTQLFIAGAPSDDLEPGSRRSLLDGILHAEGLHPSQPPASRRVTEVPDTEREDDGDQRDTELDAPSSEDDAADTELDAREAAEVAQEPQPEDDPESSRSNSES